MIRYANAVLVADFGLPLAQTHFNLRARTMHENEAYSQAVQQRNVVDDVGETVGEQGITLKNDYERPASESIDVRRRVAKPVGKLAFNSLGITSVAHVTVTNYQEFTIELHLSWRSKLQLGIEQECNGVFFEGASGEKIVLIGSKP